MREPPANQDGRGTTFWVALPSAITMRKESSEQKEVRIGRRSILVVDDEDVVRNVARKALENQGFNVLLAEDGLQALEIMAHDPRGIDAVLLDMTMPRMDGETAFRVLRELRPDLRVVLSSGYNEQDATSAFVGKGLAGFLQKPYRASDLIDAVASALSSR